MEPLRPEALRRGSGPASPGAQVNWFAQHAVGLATLAIGAIAFVVVTLTQEAVWSLPDWRLTVPFFVAAVVGLVVSLARREGLPVLPLAGVGLAAVTMAMGWFLVMAAVIAVVAVLILIMSVVM